jgi:hypothetical protein
MELYQQIPASRHHEIVVSGDRLFFDGDEYVIQGDDRLEPVRSIKSLEQQMAEIIARLDNLLQ